MLPTYETLDRITLADLQALVDTSAPENDRIDYKGRDAYSENEAAKKWCKTLSAFANAGGGCVLLGVEEEDGCASALVGFDGDTDKLILKLSQWAESGIRPRIMFRHERIDIGGGKKVVLLATPSSRSKPHMVVCNDDGRCYKRAASHNQPMDIDELRDAVMQSDSPRQIALNTHRAMIERHSIEQAHPVGAQVLTFYPVPASEGIINPALLPVQELYAISDSLGMRGDGRPTFHGWQREGTRGDLFRLSRSGIMGSFHQGAQSSIKDMNIPDRWLGGYLSKNIAKGTLQLAEWTGIRSYFVCFSYLNVSGWTLGEDRMDDLPTVSDQSLEFTPIFIEVSETDSRKTIKGWMDQLFQACGSLRCDMYDEHGEPEESKWQGVQWR